MTASDQTNPDTGSAAQHKTSKQQRVFADAIVVLLVTLTTYLVAGYFELAERYIDWTALGEIYQLDEIVFVLLAGCLGLIWFSIRRQREQAATLQKNITMQQALRETNNDISRLLQENQALINHMTEVRESERHYLATELHDVFGQHLAAMDANLTVAKHLASGNNENFQQVLDSVISSTTHLRELTRNKLRQLKPPSLNSIGLSGAVRELVSDWQQTYDDIEIEMDIELDDQQPCEAVSLAIYRALQEGLVNIARHAEASMAEIRLWSSQENASAMVNLTLKDNGRGLPEQQQSPGSGLGLVGIRERSHALGGRFEIGNRKPRGAQLTITLPFNSSN